MGRFDYQDSGKPLQQNSNFDVRTTGNSVSVCKLHLNRPVGIPSVKTACFALSDGQLRRYNHGFLRRRLVLTRSFIRRDLLMRCATYGDDLASNRANGPLPDPNAAVA